MSALGNSSSEQLKSFIGRVESLEEEKKSIADDIRDVYAEAKGTGFDVKALRAIVRMRKQDADERKEEEAILETYMSALGMLFDTPLGQAAAERATDAAGNDGRIERSRARTRESMDDLKSFAKDAADKGLISEEAAAETAQIADSIKRKFGGEQVDLEGAIEEKTRQAAANPKVQRAFKKLGTPVELTDEERDKGYSAAFIGKDGTRMAIGCPKT